MLAPLHASLLALSVLLGSPVSAGFQPPEPGPTDLFLPQSGITVRAKARLADIVEELVGLGRTSVTYEQTVAQQLTAAPCGLVTDVTVPAERFPAFVESLLALQGFAITAVRLEDPAVLVVHRAGDSRIEPSPYQVKSEEEFADHAALRVRLQPEFEHLDERMLPVLLRPVCSGDVISLWMSDEHLMIDGPGVLVGDVVNLLRSLDPDNNIWTTSDPAELFGPVRSELDLGGRTTLLDMVHEYGRVTDLHPALTPEAREILERSSFSTDAERGATVAAEDVHQFVSELLHARGLATAFMSSGRPRVLGIYPVTQASRFRRLPVRPESDEELSRYPALQVVLSRAVENMDARVLPVKLRSLSPNPDHGTFIISSGRNRVIVGGSAGDLGPFLSAIDVLDEQGR